MHLLDMTAAELAEALAAKTVSAVELTRACLERIAAVEPKVHAFITVCAEEAFKQAADIDRRRLRGEPLPPLAGIPVAVKDNICTAGIRTSCASRMLQDFVPPYDATVVMRLKQAGAVVVGKTNMDEFAMGSTTEYSFFGPTRNPWRHEYVPGGTSGGSAAALAARAVPLALGSDTGGSVRLPAAFCGVMGLKPTYGRVSRYGLVAFASSLEQIGPMARSVRDLALLYDAIGGWDDYDQTTLPAEFIPTLPGLNKEIKGLRVGVPAEYFGPGLESAVREKVRSRLKVLQDLGLIVEEISLPTTEYAVAAYYVIAMAEASSNLARYDGVRYGHRAAGRDILAMFTRTRQEGFGPEVKRRIMIGTYVLSAGYYDEYYRKAQEVRTLIRRELEAAFTRCDLLLTPTAPVLPWMMGEKQRDPLTMYLADCCTVPANLAGLPGLSLPCGFVDGLPVGMQLLGPALSEPLLLRVAYHYEQAAASCHATPPEGGGAGGI